MSGQAWRVGPSFGLDQLQLSPRSLPAPGPGEVLLRVRATALNYRDLLMIQGQYDPRQPLPLVPCSDAVGEVIALGPGAQLSIGQRVLPAFAPDWLAGPPARDAMRQAFGGPRQGLLASHAVVPAAACVPAPAHLTDAQAASLPCAGVTAWRALFTLGQLQPGQRLLVQGTGGVASFAIQLGRLAGAEVIAVTGKPQAAAALGATATVDRHAHPQWGRQVLDLTGGVGVDLVLELGGADTLNESLRCVRAGGQVALIGILGGASPTLPLTRIFMQQVRVQGIYVGSRDDLAALCGALTAHPALLPVVDRVFDFTDAPAAFSHLASQAHVGKVVVAGQLETQPHA